MLNLSKVYIEKIYDIIRNSFVKVKTSSGVVINKNSELYDELLGILNTYLMKVPSVSARYISKILKKDYIEFIISSEKVVNNYCYLSIIETNEKPSFYVIIVIDDKVLTKDDLTKEEVVNKIKQFVSLNIKDIIYSIYQEYIRYNLIVEFNRLKHDKQVLNLITHILSGFFLKIFGKKYAPSLEESQIKLLNMFTTYLIYTYYLKYPPKDALSFTYDFYKENKKYNDVIDKFKELAKQNNITKYTDFKQFGSLLDEVGIIHVPGTKFIYTLINEIGTRNLIDIMSSYPSLICNFIIAKYPVDYLSKKMIVGNLNDELEKYIQQHYL